jgi:hypothetical protein
MNDDQNANSFVSDQTQSYVDAYSPPAVTQPGAAPMTQAQEPEQVDSYVQSSVPQPPLPQSQPLEPAPLAYDDQMMSQQPTVLGQPPTPNQSTTPATQGSEGLEEQNIFLMLGVSDGTEAQKEAFLDELQQVIWEDFLENDVELLISSEDYLKMQELLKDRDSVDLEQQEKIVVFLDIMLEKALALKGDMFKERIAGMRQFFANKQEELAKIDQAEQLMQQSQWRSASELLNTLRS